MTMDLFYRANSKLWRPFASLSMTNKKTFMLLEVLNLLKDIQGLFYDNFAGTFGQISPIPGFVSSLFVGLFMADVSAGIITQRNNKSRTSIKI
jgi:hypothetical protein